MQTDKLRERQESSSKVDDQEMYLDCLSFLRGLVCNSFICFNDLKPNTTRNDKTNKHTYNLCTTQGGIYTNKLKIAKQPNRQLQANRQTEMQAGRQIVRKIARQTDRQPSKQISKLTDRQAVGQAADKQQHGL